MPGHPDAGSVLRIGDRVVTVGVSSAYLA